METFAHGRELKKEQTGHVKLAMQKVLAETKLSTKYLMATQASRRTMTGRM